MSLLSSEYSEIFNRIVECEADHWQYENGTPSEPVFVDPHVVVAEDEEKSESNGDDSTDPNTEYGEQFRKFCWTIHEDVYCIGNHPKHARRYFPQS